MSSAPISPQTPTINKKPALEIKRAHQPISPKPQQEVCFEKSSALISPQAPNPQQEVRLQKSSALTSAQVPNRNNKSDLENRARSSAHKPQSRTRSPF